MASTRRQTAARLVFRVFASVLGCAGCGILGAAPATTTQVPSPAQRLIPVERAAVTRAEAAVAVKLPTVEGSPAPNLGPAPFVRPFRAHQVVGFLPYWDVGSFTPDYQSLTALAYWAVGLGTDGSLDQQGAGYSTLTSAALGLDISQAHAAGDRVLLTVFSQSPSVLHAVAAHPATAGPRLARDVAALLHSGAFDGVDLDLEGNSTPDRGGFVRFVASFSRTLRTLGPTWSIMLDTYPTSALDPLGFFDVKALIAYVDEFFVMAYDMQVPGVASATAPLTNATWSDAITLAQYTSVVPAGRIVLGIPLYGYDFPSMSRFDGAATMGSPLAVTYAEIVAAGHKQIWDPVTETPWTVFKRDGKWHQTWFDDPVSIALKSALAAQFHCAGVGVWELGMSGSDTAITTALLGGRAPLKLPLAGT